MSFYRNESNQVVAFLVKDAAGEPLPGDAANITAKLKVDSGATAATNDTNPTEADATNHPGVIYFSLTAAETDGSVLLITPQSTTDGVTFDPVTAVIYTTDRPAAPEDQMDLIAGLNEDAIAAIVTAMLTPVTDAVMEAAATEITDPIIAALPESAAATDTTALAAQITQLMTLLQESMLLLARSAGLAQATPTIVAQEVSPRNTLPMGTAVVITLITSPYRNMSGTISGIIRDNEYVVRLPDGRTAAVPFTGVRVR